MALAQATKSHETTYTLDDAMDILLTKLDDAIHDMEAGRVQTIEEAWKEIDEILPKKILKKRRNISLEISSTVSMQNIFPER